MNRLLIFSFVSLLVACSHQATQMDRHPASLSSLENELTETEKHYENLERLKNASRSEVYVEFTDSGIEGRTYVIKGEVFSNNLDGIKKAEIVLDKDDHAWNVKLVKKDDRVYIDEVVPFKLSVANTKIRFHFEEGFRDVELFCTRAGKCL